MLFCLSPWTMEIRFQLQRKWSGENSYFIRKIPRNHKYSLQQMKVHSRADSDLGMEEELPRCGGALHPSQATSGPCFSGLWARPPATPSPLRRPGNPVGVGRGHGFPGPTLHHLLPVHPWSISHKAALFPLVSGLHLLLKQIINNISLSCFPFLHTFQPYSLL